MNANPILLQKKYTRIVELFAKKQNITLDEALDFFYHSTLYQLVREGVSDMHCMSDGYLVEELEEEFYEYSIIPMKRRAHITKSGREQEVLEHLRTTAMLTKEYAKKVGCPNLGYLTGLLHDLGKGTDAFNRYIGLVSSGESWHDSKLNHSAAGARYLFELCSYKTSMAERFTLHLVCEAILCHHSGLCDNYTQVGEDGFQKRINTDTDIYYAEAVEYFQEKVSTRQEVSDLFHGAVGEVSNILNKVSIKPTSSSDLYYACGLLMKMLFSCLIDADRYDTATFMDGIEVKLEEERQSLWEGCIDRVDRAIANLNQDSELNRARSYISDQCRQAAVFDGGVYTLNCPTGSGKTYSSIRFALHHAKEKRKRQIFYIIPFMTVIDQNAEAIRQVLGEDEFAEKCIMELHSNIVKDNKDEEQKLLTERMDAPIVLTTMVRFLNTFFSGGTQNLRPGHQFANAIIIFDEVQTLPIRCVQMFNGLINFLTQVCDSTCILCTATQPLLNRSHGDVKPIRMGNPEGLVTVKREVQEVFKRVIPIDDRKENGYTVEELRALVLEKANQEGDCLVVMNTKSSALKLFQEIQNQLKLEDNESEFMLFFLSTKLCPAHRKEIVNDVKQYLGRKQLIVVSTQLIEAGVDLSFRCAIRAIAGLDSWVQTAGRCNRNGVWGKKNTYIVNPAFETLSYLPDIKVGAECTHQVLNEFQKDKDSFDGDLFSEKAIQRYFEIYLHKQREKMFYSLTGKHKGSTLYGLLEGNMGYRTSAKGKLGNHFQNYILGQAFETAGNEFEAIEQIGKTVLVPYKHGKDIIAELLSHEGIWQKKEILRRAQQYAVNLSNQDIDLLGEEVRFYEEAGVYVLNDLYYDTVCGVTLEAATDNTLYTL